MFITQPITMLCIAIAAVCLIGGRALCRDTDPAPVSSDDVRQWRFDCQREQIAPKHWIDKRILHDNKPTLALAGDGKSYANGMWTRSVTVAPGRWYRFETRYLARNVQDPNRSVLARLTWLDAEAKPIGKTEYPRTLPGADAGGWRVIGQDYKAPDTAVSARLELIYRWDADGQAHFSPATLEAVEPPKPRKVRLATVFHKPDARSPAGNIRQFAKLVERAAKLGADIVCLPEGATLYGTKQTYVSVAEPIPGPSSDALGRIAARHNLYIVAGLFEKIGPAVYNTAVLIDRRGKLIGKYRKVCLPREEIEGGVTPGDRFEVFETDFGKVGMMICWDSQFPEPARALAMRGAEVIFLPIWGGNVTLTKARAIENQVYVVTCTYGMISAVIGLDGEILAEATPENPVAVAEVDLSHRMLWPWLGDFKNRIPREMPPRSAVARPDDQ